MLNLCQGMGDPRRVSLATSAAIRYLDLLLRTQSEFSPERTLRVGSPRTPVSAAPTWLLNG